MLAENRTQRLPDPLAPMKRFPVAANCWQRPGPLGPLFARPSAPGGSIVRPRRYHLDLRRDFPGHSGLPQPECFLAETSAGLPALGENIPRPCRIARAAH